MSLEIIMLGGLILLFSSIMKGIAGFGTALFALPLLTAFFFTPEEARPIIVSINLMLNFFILLKEKNFTFANFKSLSPLIISGFVFAVGTGFFLGFVDARIFNIILGSLLVFTALNKLIGFNFSIKRYKPYFIPIGSLGGVLNTLIGAGGVPVLIFFSNTPLKKESFRLNILLYFFAINIGAITSFLIFGDYPLEALGYTAVFTPFVVIGSLIGMRALGRINNTMFQRIVAVLLLVMGLDSILNIL